MIISLGSNLGDRRHYLRAAVRRLAKVVRIVRVSSLYETEPVGSPRGSPPFLNLAVLALSFDKPMQLLEAMLQIEAALGRRRRSRNEFRVIDLDLILFGSRVLRTRELTLPHPRFRTRNFVLAPMRELRLSWNDPITGKRVTSFRGEGTVRQVGRLY